MRIAQENLDLQKRSYDIADVLYRNGQSNELDVQQAEFGLGEVLKINQLP